VVIGLISRRAAQLVPILFGVTFVSFMILNLLPGNVAYSILGDTATPSAIAILNKQLGLNHPLMDRYWQWLVSALHGNLGQSLLSDQSVTHIILQRAPVSFELGFLAILLALLVAVPSAVFAVRKPGGMVDRISTVVSMGAISMPGFVFALILILIFGVKLHLVNPTGFTPLSQGLWPNLKSLILPAISVAVFPFALYLRVLRGDMTRNYLDAHYVETARAKGLSETRILLTHVLPNSSFSLLTVVMLNLGTVVGGAVIIEQIFGLPGMGQTLVAGIYDRDSPVVQGIVVSLAVAVVAANLLGDILYIIFDPRLRHGR
jgi:peptide/nickel transport system permease protein